MTPVSTLVTPNAVTRRYWLRAYHRALRHLHRAATAYVHALTTYPDLGWPEWETWQTARRRAAFISWHLAAVMGR